MASSQETILKSLLSRPLYRNQKNTLSQISVKLFKLGLKNNKTGKALSQQRIEEYLEGVRGINKERSTGKKTPIK